GREGDEVLRCVQLCRVGLDVVVLEGRLVQGKTGQILARRIGAAKTRLAVAVETEVRVEVAAALDRFGARLLRGDLVTPALGARVGSDDEDREEVPADQGEDGEEHPRSEEDLPVKVRADLERIRRRRDRRDVVRRRLFDGLAGRVVLLDELRAGLLLRFERLLVEDQVAEEGQESREHEEAGDGEDEVQVELHLLGDLEIFGIPDIRLAIDDVERVGVHDERTARIGDDVEELERLWGGSTLHHRGVLVVERAVAGAVKLVLRAVPGNAAPQMGALAVRRDDPPGWMDEEELSLEVEDRNVVRRLKRGQDVVLRAHCDLHPEAKDLVRLVEGDHERGDLSDGEERADQEAQPKQLTTLDAPDKTLKGRVGVGPDHLPGSKHWWVAGTAHGANRSIPGPRREVPTTVSTT